MEKYCTQSVKTNTDSIFQVIFFGWDDQMPWYWFHRNFTSTSWLLSCHPTTLFRGRVARNSIKLQNPDNGSTYKVDYRLISSFGRALVCMLSGKSRVQTLAGTTLRVFKWPRGNCCLCNNIWKLLDFLVFSDKDEKRRGEVPSHSTFTWVGDVDPGSGVANLSLARWVDYPARRDG